MVVEKSEQRQDVLPARAGQIPGTRDGDGAGRGELRDHSLGESSDRLGQEDRLRADANQIATLGQRGNDLSVQAVVGFERGRRRRLERLPLECSTCARPRRLLLSWESRDVADSSESAAPVGDPAIADEAIDERVESLRREVKR